MLKQIGWLDPLAVTEFFFCSKSAGEDACAPLTGIFWETAVEPALIDPYGLK